MVADVSIFIFHGPYDLHLFVTLANPRMGDVYKHIAMIFVL